MEMSEKERLPCSVAKEAARTVHGPAEAEGCGAEAGNSHDRKGYKAGTATWVGWELGGGGRGGQQGVGGGGGGGGRRELVGRPARSDDLARMLEVTMKTKWDVKLNS